MKTEVIKCGRCGEDILPDELGYGYKSHIDFTLKHWYGGGSTGGEITIWEGEDHFDYDLCEYCSCELSCIMKMWIKHELKIQED